MINPLQTRAAAPALLEDNITPWMGPLAPWTRRIVIDNEERARRWFLMCVVLSMLLHFGLLLIPIKMQMGQPASNQPAQWPLTVHLARPVAPPEEIPPLPRPAQRHPPVIAARRPASRSKPTFSVPPQTELPALNPQTEPPTDVFNLAEKRAGRQAAEAAAVQENAGAAISSVDDVVGKNLARATKTVGTGGIFQVIYPLGVREGTFKFNGWHPGTSDNWHATYTVDAGVGGNVHVAIIKKMIEVIRKSYSGDFEFESNRQGRVVPLSARLADNAALENFLMKEIFDENMPIPSR